MESKISIVVPTCDRTELLLETLSSVKAQTSPAWECLIVDDGSSEDHIKTVSKWIEGDAGFRLLHRSGHIKGAPACRNLGWKAARHELIVFLDSDDLLSEHCVANRLQVVSEWPEFDFWVFSTLLFDHRMGDSNILLNIMTEEDPISRFIRMDVIWLSSGVLWKKASLKQLGGWDEALLSWQDWDLSLRALLTGLRFTYIPEVDNYFRVRSSERVSIGRKSFSAPHLLSHEKLADKICALVAEEPRYLRVATYIYFWIADQWIQKGNFSRALGIWASASANLNPVSYFANKLMLFGLAVPGFGPLLRKILRQFNHPGLRYWRDTFKRVRRSNGTPEQEAVQDLLKAKY